MQGWIKVHRKILDSPVFDEPGLLKLWIYCLTKATHKPVQILVGQTLVNLEPGQFVTGRNALSDNYNKGMKPKNKVSDITLWRWLLLLEKMGNLNIKTTNKFSIVTIDKWGFYQGSEEENEQQNVHQMNNKCTSNEQQMNTNKNVKNVKNEKNDKELIPFVEIVDYLNLKAGTKYKHTSKKTKDLITARWNDKFVLEDFQKVIDKKTAEWLNDPGMNQYLRPETLFGTKFEGYLNAKGGQARTGGINNSGKNNDADIWREENGIPF